VRAITRRAIGVAAGVGSFTAAITLGGIGTASAYAPAHNGGSGGNNGGGSDCRTIGIEYSLDGGHTWTTDGRINGDTPPTTVTVKIKGAEKGCEYNISLASYSAEGPSWENSGHQDFLGWDTTTLSKNKKTDTLDISGVAPTCFGQVDLYGNGTKFDGGSGKGHGPLPHYPDSATPTNLITAWNGGHKCDETPTPTPTDTTDTPTPTPSDTTDTPTPTPTDTTDTPTPTPSDTTDTPTPTPTDTGDTSSPSPSPSTSTTSGGGGSTTPPTGTPSVPPATSGSGSGNLAETGSNSSQNTVFLGGGAALLVAGGAAVYFTRRRRSGAHS
jgi:LPXTG-motif cell wall-anchored protein